MSIRAYLLAGVFSTFMFLFVESAQASEGAALQNAFVWTGSAETAPAYTVFRKTFHASDVSDASLSIFADARYVLWINGSYVQRGPARFDPASPEFDTVPVTSHLQAGTNTITVMVMSFPTGSGAVSGQMLPHAPGLALRLVCGPAAARTTVLTDTTWKWRTGLRYLAPKIEWGFVNDTIDARLDDGDWTAAGYNDSAWAGAVPIAGGQWGALRPRTLPPLRETGVAVSGPALPLVINAGDVRYFTLPRMAMAWFEIDADGGASGGGSLRVEVGLRGSASSMSESYGNLFDFTARAGRQKAFITDPRGFRYIKVTGTGGSVTLHGLRVVERRFPFDDLGSFTSNDAFLNDLWQRSVHTIRMNTEEGYTDAALRERSQWMGDAAVVGYPVARVTLAGPGGRSDTTMLRQIVRHIAQSGGLYNNGRMRANAPSNRVGELYDSIEDYDCLWVQALRQLVEASGDTSPALDHWNQLTALMNWFLARKTARGLVNAREFVIFDNPLRYVTGEGATINAFVYRALLDAAAIADFIGETAQAAVWRAEAASLKTAYNTHLWDAARGTYFGGLQANGTPHAATAHAAILALDRGIVPPERLEAVRAYMRSTYSGAIRYPYVAFWAMNNLYEMESPARDTEALAYFRSKWAAVMARTDTGTLTEEFNAGESCHAFGAVPAYFLSTRVLGVRMDGPLGNARVLIEPRPGDLTSAAGTVVTDHGLVPVGWNRAPSSFTLNATVPSGTSATVALPANLFAGSAPPERVAANGVVVWENGAWRGGAPGLSFESSNGNFLRFTAAAGGWSFLVTGLPNEAPEVTIAEPPGKLIRLPGLANSLRLSAEATDDNGTPVLAWTRVSGPGAVVFSDPSSERTSASFSAPGSYLLRVAADDGLVSAQDEITVLVGPDAQPVPEIINLNFVPGTTGNNPDVVGAAGRVDAESTQAWNTLYSNTANNANATFAGTSLKNSRNLPAAVSFTLAGTYRGYNGQGTPTIPQFANIFRNYAFKNSAGNNTFTIGGLTPSASHTLYFYNQNAGWGGNAATWTVGGNTLTFTNQRMTTNVWADWENKSWGKLTATSNASGVITGNWGYTGSGENNWNALQIVHTPTANSAPQVNPGTAPAAAVGVAAPLAGSASDDGLPAGSTMATAWSLVSGPGTATFGDAGSAVTTVTFSAPGAYLLRLAATDGTTTVFQDLSVMATAQSFAGWINTQTDVGAATAPGDDADGDGVPNLLEFAFGTAPNSHASRPGFESQISNFKVQLTFTPAVTQGLRFHVDASSDLSDWSDTSDITNLLTPGTPYTHTDSANLSTATRRFLRLRVEISGP